MQETVFESFHKLWEATELLQEKIDCAFIEALSENLQNLVQGTVQQINGNPPEETKEQLTQIYQAIQLEKMTAEEVRRLIQYAFLKGAKEDGLQTNYQMTPDAIALLLAFMLNELVKKSEKISLADLSVGSANLLTATVNFLQAFSKKVAAIGVDNDDLLIHLASQSVKLQNLPIELHMQDSIQQLHLSNMDAIVSDLPVGYYPLDAIAKDYQTASQVGHSYAHHLLIEKSIHHLNENGWALFIVPIHLFETKESKALLHYLQKEVYIQAMLHLPKKLFEESSQQKAVLILQKKGNCAKQARQVLLGNIPDFKQDNQFIKFTNTFVQWAKELNETE